MDVMNSVDRELDQFGKEIASGMDILKIHLYCSLIRTQLKSCVGIGVVTYQIENLVVDKTSLF